MTRTRLLIAAVPVALLVAGCGSSGSRQAIPPASSATAPSTAGTGTGGSSVTYTVAQYTLPALTVSPGATVKVVDGDGEPHTVTADDGSFNTGSFDQDHPGSFTAPSKPGNYAIHCEIHPSMHGTIIVR